MNVFICNTPFQFYYTQLILREYSHIQEQHFIISTFQNKSEVLKDLPNLNIIPRDIIQIIKLIIKIKKVQKEKNVNIYIPHIDGIILNTFYQIFFKTKNVEFNIYYEGIALFRPSNFKIKQSSKKIIFKLLLSLFTCFRTKGIFYLNPIGLSSNSNVFSPIPIKSQGNTYIVELPKFKKGSILPHHAVIFLSPYDNLEVLEQVLNKVQMISKLESSKIYIKPHFNTSIDFNYLEKFKILDPSSIGETIIEESNFQWIFFTHFSSLILNLNLKGIDSNRIFLHTEATIPDLIIGDLEKPFFNKF